MKLLPSLLVDMMACRDVVDGVKVMMARGRSLLGGDRAEVGEGGNCGIGKSLELEVGRNGKEEGGLYLGGSVFATRESYAGLLITRPRVRKPSMGRHEISC